MAQIISPRVDSGRAPAARAVDRVADGPPFAPPTPSTRKKISPTVACDFFLELFEGVGAGKRGRARYAVLWVVG